MVYINDGNQYILKQAIDANQPLDKFDTSNVTNMRWMFYTAKSFNQPLDNFDTSNVTDMNGMFSGATSFNQPLDNFDTSNVTEMGCMFNNARNFNQPLDNFDLRNITDMYCMFDGATSMFIGYIMRFAAKAIFVYHKYEAMRINRCRFSNSSGLDWYIIRLNGINDQAKIDSVLDGFIVD